MLSIPFILRFYSTSRLDWDRLNFIAEETVRLSRGRRLHGQWTTDSQSFVEPIDDFLAAVRRRKLRWNGCLTLVFGDDDGISGRWDLLNLPVESGREVASSRDAGYRMHLFELEISDARRREPEFDSALFAYFARVASIVDAHFSLGHDDDGFLKHLHAGHGLEAGLPDVYRLNAYGPTFVSLIGADNLASLPIPRVLRTESGGVTLRLDGNLARAASNEVAALRSEVRLLIGEQYFLQSNATSAGLNSLGGGPVGLLSFLRALVVEKRIQGNEAKVRPSFDWSGLFANDLFSPSSTRQ